MVESGNTRQRNLLMLLYAMDTAGEATAAYLAEQTGLSVATISRGLSLLKAKKLIVQRRKDTTEVGRRPDVFSINGAYAHCMYCCLDGDALRGYLLDLRGKVVARHVAEANSQMTVADFLDKLAELKQVMLEKKRSSGCVLTVSLAIPGLTDMSSGIISRIPNFPCFENVNLAELVREKLGHPCFIYNVARLSAVGAYLQNQGQIENLVYMDITGDCGIGAGIVLGGKLYEDRNCLAGEVGDMVIRTEREGWSDARNQGALEREAGLSSVFREADQMLQRGLAPELQKLLDKQGEDTLSLSVLEKAAGEFDLDIYALLNKTTKAWAAAIVNISALLAPDVIILGGAVHQGHKLIEKMLRHHLHHMYHRPISLQLAKKSADTHVLGAAHLSGRFLLEMSLADTQIIPAP
ncbi:MAG: ROK family transcriptional regulator [Oscillospiraceae bacterium]|nr:ROK family transcriptional regulator [Oscillospiraceae bacterium]